MSRLKVLEDRYGVSLRCVSYFEFGDYLVLRPLVDDFVDQELFDYRSGNLDVDYCPMIV